MPKKDDVYEELMSVNNDLANLQRELSRRNAELAAMNEQKNQFLGMAAHDLRSPLGAIMTYSEFLEAEAGPQLSEEHLDFITTIKDSSHFMLGLINDLLDVTQFESGKLKMDLRPVDLIDLTRKNLALNLALAAKKQIRISLDVESPLPPLLLDRGKIEQVLNNLLSNAIKFSHVNTEVHVVISRKDPDAWLAIEDQGQGIPEQDLPKLFKPFSRTSVRSTGGESSTGLGLSIVRRIVEGHGGSVNVKSQVGKGTLFTVCLPLDPSTKPAASAT
jgi:signal transduction histidine kinase